MAWSVPKIGALAEVASGNLTLAEPAGIVQGELMVCFISYRSNAAFTVPGDWTLVATQQSSGDTDATNGIASGLMMWCVRGASAPTLTFNRTAGDVAQGRILAYSGNQKPSPFDVGTANTLAVASATVTTGTFTTAQANELIVAMVSCGDNLTTSAFDAATDPATASGATDTTTAPTVGTWIERADNGTGTGADNALAIADSIRGTAGATGTIQATVSAIARHVMIAAAFKIDLAPTIALNTADAHDFGNDPTPTVEATGTDGNADDVRYWFQIDPVNTFDSLSGAIDSYSETNQDGLDQFYLGSPSKHLGQAFAGANATVRRIRFYLSKTGSPVGTMTAELWSHTGTFGSTGTPNALLVGGETFDVSTLSTSLALISFAILPTAISAGTNYFVVLKFAFTGGDSSNRVNIGYDASSPTAAGNNAYYNGSTWSAGGVDTIFYVDSTGPLLGKISGTDAGFLNTVSGGDTDPFNSGEKASYTVQAGDALADGTWYWRARALDPNGGNTWSAWATARTFTVTTVPPPDPGKKLFAALLAKRHFDMVP